MSSSPSKPDAGRKRNHRGRPRTQTGASRQSTDGPTRARLLALRIIERVDRAGSYADLALHHALSRSTLSGVDRALATELVYGTLRWRGRLDFLLSAALDRDLDSLDALVASTLRLGAYQLVFSDRIPESAAVDQAVRCARAIGAEHATGLVNAVLRRVAREHRNVAFPDLATDPVGHLTHALSMPRWIAERWIDALGPDEAAALAEASNQVPPLTIRANPNRSTSTELIEELRTRFPDAAACRWARDGIELRGPGDPGQDPHFLDGRFTVQDEASQLVVELLDPQPGESILDTCAAPGTKTTGIAERIAPHGTVLALDRNARRLTLVARSARRLGLAGILILERDATRSLLDLPEHRARVAASNAANAPSEDSSHLGGGADAQSEAEPIPISAAESAPHFDRILVDAPCSGLGSLRRNADARWRVNPEDPAALSVVQQSILTRASEVLRPGGSLVYSTCTLLTEENDQVVSRFLADHPDFRLVPRNELPERMHPVVDENGFMRCFPHRHHTDGFFAARLERTQ